MSEYIPFELQLEIIKRLPVKSLLQFRSVSTGWKSLIDGSEFIAIHTVHHAHSHRLLVSYDDPKDNEQKYITFIDNHTFPQQKSALTVPPFINLLNTSRIVGSYQGLLCLYGCQERYNLRTDTAVLWNPSVRKFVDIAVSDAYQPYETVLGFGVCPVTGNPKIVKISQYSLTNKPRKSAVYTLSSRKWRSLSTDLPSKSIVITWSQIVIDRFIYWFASDMIVKDGGFQTRNLILSFDMTREEFKEVVLPDSLALKDAINLSISKVRESLVVLEDIGKQVCAVWVMDRGVERSFTQLFTINAPDAALSTRGFTKSGIPIIEMGDDDDNSLRPTALVVYEPNSQRVIDFGISGKYFSFTVNSYMETLLLLGRSDCLSY